MTTQQFVIVLLVMAANIALWAAVVTAFFQHGKRHGFGEDEVGAAVLLALVLGAVSAGMVGGVISAFT